MDFRILTKINRNMMIYKKRKIKDDLNETEFEMIRYLTKHNEGLPMNFFASYLNVDKSLITRMSKKLQKLEYISISYDDVDLRKKILKPLPKALKLKSETFDEEANYYELIIQCLTEKEKVLFHDLAHKVYIESKKLRKCNRD